MAWSPVRAPCSRVRGARETAFIHPILREDLSPISLLSVFNMQIASTTQPLSDVLPWGNPITVSSSDKSHDLVNDTCRSVVDVDDRTLLITDATSTDGRFVLHTLALQFLSNRHSLEEPSVSMNSSDDYDNSSPATNNSTVMEGAVLWISCTSVAKK